MGIKQRLNNPALCGTIPYHSELCVMGKDGLSMQKLIEGSLVCRAAAAANLWFGRQWRGSRVLGRFLSADKGEKASENSVFARVWVSFHRGLSTAFERLRINELLRGSIFTSPFAWSLAAISLAPILPTMTLLPIAAVGMVSLLLAFGCNKQRRLSYFPANKYILLYAFVVLGATFTSVTVSGSLRSGLLTWFFILFAIVIQNSVTTRRQFDMIIYAFVVSGLAVSAYGVYQYVFGAVGASGWLDSDMFSDIGVRVYSTLENPNVLAMYLLLVIPFAVATIFVVKGFVPKLFFAGCLGAMLLCMLLTFARGGWLGLITAAALFFIMLDRRFIVVGIAGIIIMYFALPDVIVGRFLSIGDVGDGSTSYRLSIWLATIDLLRDYWFTGIGPGTVAFNRIYPLYSFNAAAAQHSHNLYLQIICNAGIVGLAFFFATIFAFFRGLFYAVSTSGGLRFGQSAKNLIAQPPNSLHALNPQNIVDDKNSKIFQMAAISSIFGFLVQGFTDYSFYNYRVTFVFWAVLGLGILAARRPNLKGSAAD